MLKRLRLKDEHVVAGGERYWCLEIPNMGASLLIPGALQHDVIVRGDVATDVGNWVARIELE